MCKDKVSLILFLVFISYVISYFLPVEDIYILIFADIFFAFIAFTASFFCLLPFKLYGKKSLQGRVWLLLSVGLFLWGVGEILWAYYELILGISPFPSWADLFYTLGYVPLIISSAFFSFFVKTKKTKILLLPLLVSIFYFILSFHFVLHPIAISKEAATFEKMMLWIYPIADVFLIFGGLVLFEMFKGGKLSKVWLLLSLAFISTAIADTLFSYFDWNGLYELGSPYDWIDFLWILSYLLFIYAAWYEKKTVKKLTKDSKVRRKRKKRK